MGTGYTRNDTANNIADGNVINASDIDGEFDAIQSAFNATTGHSHDGTTGEGPQIDTGGLADSAVTTTKINNDAVTLGTKTSGNYVATGAVSGVGLSGSASAEGATFTVTSNATSANTASTIVARDASGNFSAGTVTAALTGNADTATTLETARTIAGQSFDGSANITIASTDLSDSGSINAATLDSLDSTSFLRSDAADTKTSGDLSFADNVKATFGAGSDLQIYHDGSHSYIAENGVGNLYIQYNDLFLQSNTGENYIYCNNDAQVTLYYDNAPKVSTTSGGIDVTGTVTADGLTVDVPSGETNYDAISLDAPTSTFRIRCLNTDDANPSWRVQTNTSEPIKFAQAGVDRFEIDGNGDISFYDSTGVTQGLFWDASTQRLGLGTTAPAGLMEVKVASGQSGATQGYRLVTADGGGYAVYPTSAVANPTFLHNVNSGESQAFGEGGTAHMTITSGGNVGMGTASPSTALDVNGTVTADGLTLGDSDKAIFGASQDLQIYHDGSNSWINEVGTGQLILAGEDVRITTPNAGEFMATFGVNGAATLYHDNAAKIATTSTGIDVTGVITTDGMTTSANINFGDSDKAIFGASNDLQIYHSGTHSFIDDAGTGNLYIRSSNLRLQKYTGENMIIATADGAVTLYHDNAEKLATTSYGVDISGSVVADTNSAGSKTGSQTPDFNTYQNFVWTLTGNITLANPSTEKTGQSGFFIFIHSGAARTVSLGTDYETAGAAGLTLSGTSGAVDIVPYVVQSAGNILLGTPQLAFS